MLMKDDNTGLLTPRERRELADVSEPNLLRDMFPYSEVPRMPFDGLSVPMEPAKEMFITDTTFRDGQQARPPYTVQQIVDLYDMMHRLGGPNGIIRASEFFLYSDKDRESVEACLARGCKYPEVTGWIRANKKDFELVKALGLKETGILTSASDYHIFHKFKKTRSQCMREYLEIVRTAFDAGLDSVRCHLEDITRADFYGFIMPFVQQLMEVAKEARKVVKIRMCDTMGYGLPFAEAALPRSVPKMVYALRHEGGVPSEWLEWHGHNDFHKVLVNAEAAWLYGCSAANGALLGYGERTGNPPLEGLIIEYIALKGSAEGIDMRVITEIGEYFKKVVKAEVPAGYPFVGDNFNTTSAGIHSDGVLKDEEIYNIFDTRTLLNRPVGVNVTDKSGLAGIAHWVNANLGLRPEHQIDKHHPGLAAIAEWVDQQYVDGRITSISNEEMTAQARVHLPEYFKSEFDLLKERATHLSEALVWSMATDERVLSLNPKQIERALADVVHKHPFMQLAYATDRAGKRITELVTQPQFKDQIESFSTDVDYSDRDWFVGAIKTKDLFVTDFYKSKITGALCITVSAPIKDPDTQEIKGVIGADMRFEDLARTEPAATPEA